MELTYLLVSIYVKGSLRGIFQHKYYPNVIFLAKRLGFDGGFGGFMGDKNPSQQAPKIPKNISEYPDT